MRGKLSNNVSRSSGKGNGYDAAARGCVHRRTATFAIIQRLPTAVVAVSYQLPEVEKSRTWRVGIEIVRLK